jgi:diguanylate cyclase
MLATGIGLLLTIQVEVFVMAESRTASSTTEMFSAVRALDTGIHNHIEWLKTLHQTLICNAAHGNQADFYEDAHHHCHFGRWYYNDALPVIRNNALYERIGSLHKEMHIHARQLLLKKQQNLDIESSLYDRFTNEALNFKLEVRNLQFDLMNQVCAVDELTGAWNRHAMLYKLVQEQERAVRKSRELHICMLDIDNFKSINDSYGHPAGDQVLKQIAKFFAGSLRKYDSFFRYGGEEFLCCMPELSTDEASNAIERLRENLSRLQIALPSGESITLTSSFGLARVALDEGIEESIQNADHALLQAKAEGRNRLCVWGD